MDIYYYAFVAKYHTVKNFGSKNFGKKAAVKDW